jgi:hypothetical protein
MRYVIAIAAALVAAVPATAQSTATPAPATQSAFSADTPIEQIAANPKAKAVLLKTLPNILTNEAYDQFKSMSLREVQPFSDGKISDEQVATVDAGLKAIR